MSAKYLLTLGAGVVALATGAVILVGDNILLTFIAFAGGALFGKGYGLWERGQ